MMRSKLFKHIALPAAAAALFMLLLPGCSTPAGTKGSPAGSSTPSAAAATADGETATMAPTDGSQQAAGEGERAALSASDFKTVDKNPLNDTMQALLWLIANGPDTTPIPADAASNPALKALSDKYQTLLIDPGVHYTESSMGMETEYWIKGGKFKKSDKLLGQMTVFDGQSYVRYDPNGKKGMRYSKDDAMASADIAYTAKGMLASLAAAPYQQTEDRKVGTFDCAVFFMDIEVMGMKGNTLFIDKDTGLLVKYVVGDEKEKSSFITIVTKFEAGGFGDDVFTVPANITVEDFK